MPAALTLIVATERHNGIGINNALRNQLRSAIAVVDLYSPNVERRRTSAERLLGEVDETLAEPGPASSGPGPAWRDSEGCGRPRVPRLPGRCGALTQRRIKAAQSRTGAHL